MNLNRDVLFRTPFSRRYWNFASKELKIVKNITLASLLISISIVLRVFGRVLSIEIFGRQVVFNYLPLSLIAMLYGPVAGMSSGFIIDILAFIIFPTGAFHPGFTINAVLEGLIYSLFLYRCRVSIIRLFLARLFVNGLVHVVLGSLWLSQLYSASYLVFFYLGLTKNLLLLIPEVLLMFYLFQSIIPVFKHHSLISKNISDVIYFI